MGSGSSILNNYGFDTEN
jgi:dual specificity tyrosine-phosphorylation-regulated kinase 2/3/4